MKNNNPRPKLHKFIKKYVKESIGETFKQLKRELVVLEDDIIEEIYSAMAHEIDDAIEEAYNEGIRDAQEISK